ncbi:MAG: hypothetical protein GC206_08565 [Alphaproteobacteria bacterium]|nr:hypothetical protein [Alphaproteobacteria bacterium]
MRFASSTTRRRLRGVILLCAILATGSVAGAFDAAIERSAAAAPDDRAALIPAVAATPRPVRVVDGDTLDLAGERVRLFGIDAPEGGQVCASGAPGPAAAAALEALVDGGSVQCEGRDRDRYGRRVAVCAVDGTDLGASLVRAGWAWNYTRYAGDRYAAEERTARAAGRGVWAMGCDSPWDWRRAQRGATQAAR